MLDFNLEVCGIISEESFGARSLCLDVVGWILDGVLGESHQKLVEVATLLLFDGGVLFMGRRLYQTLPAPLWCIMYSFCAGGLDLSGIGGQGWDCAPALQHSMM